jgi:hypothetical protein
VLPDSADIVEVVEDARRAIREDGFEWFDSVHAPRVREGD